MPDTLHPDAPGELQLLHHALDRDDTPEAIATQVGLTPADLLDIIDTPPARAAHEASLRFVQQRNSYRTALAISVAISRLSETLRETRDPTQTLRACAILARLISPRATPRSVEPRLSIAPPSGAAPHAEPPPAPIEAAPSAQSQPPCPNRAATVGERLSPHPQTSLDAPNQTSVPTPDAALDGVTPASHTSDPAGTGAPNSPRPLTCLDDLDPGQPCSPRARTPHDAFIHGPHSDVTAPAIGPLAATTDTG